MALGPINYSMPNVNPLDSMMAGIGQMQQVQSNDQIMETQQQALELRRKQLASMPDPEQIKAMYTDLAQVLGNPGATAEDISGLLAKYPQAADQIAKPWAMMSSARQEAGQKFIGQTYAMLASGNQAMALAQADQRIAAAERSGNAQALNEAKMMKYLIQTDPVKAQNLLRAISIQTGGADLSPGGAFKGTSMDAQAYNILTDGDPASPEYAAAYAHVSRPQFNFATGQQYTPDMSAFRPPAGRGGGGGGGPSPAASGGGVTATRTPEEIKAAYETTKMTLGQLDDLANDPAVKMNLGPESLIPNIPGGKAADAAAKMKQMQGKAFLQAFEMLKGGGQITEKEGAAASAAMSRMQAIAEERGSYEAYLEALNEFKQQVLIGARKLGVDTTEWETKDEPSSEASKARIPKSLLDALNGG